MVAAYASTAETADLDRDVIDPRHTEALLRTGALQRAIFNSANFSSIATDAKGVIQIFNVGAERMLGYTAAEVMNKITPADIADPLEVIARAKALSVELGTLIKPGFEALVVKASRGIEDIYELTYIRKDGSRFPAVVSVTALRDAQDAIIGYLMIGTDNTARKQIEEERTKLDQQLRDQHFYTRALIESNIDALMATDQRGIIIDVNKQTEALTGCTRDELIGTPLKNYFTEPGRAEEGINRVLNEGNVTNYELTACARNGKLTVVSYNATTFHDRDRRLQGVFATARDVTELKRFEETLQQNNVERADQAEMRTRQAERSDLALRDSELKYRRLFEAAKDGILILDADTGRINDANPFLCTLLGFSKTEMVGKTVAELSPLKDVRSNEAMLARIQKEGYDRYDDLPLETREGRKIAVEFVSNVYQAGDRRVIQCNIRDITDRKRLEEDFRLLNAGLEQRVVDRTAQFQAANDELDAFSYSVSHDLRAPLRHVMGFVQLLQKDAGPSLTEKSLSHLATISQAAGRMGDLIDDLLAFSRNARSEMQVTAVSLTQLVNETVHALKQDIPTREIIWKIGTLPEVRGDRELLRMVLVNLISNAVKFTGSRSQATIEIGCAPSGDNEMVIFVSDNGVGFDPRYIDKLFGVFQRLHSSEEFEGTGIGLANVRRIIHRHGGRVWAKGAVDGGATFCFSIPTKVRAV